MQTIDLVREWRTFDTTQGSLEAYVAAPAGKASPGVLLLQEIFGVNAAMREAADQFALQGFAVAVPDLFWRQERRVELGYAPEDRKRGFGLMQGHDFAASIADIVALGKILPTESEFAAPVSVLGFCLGGKLAVLAGAQLPAAAIISFYGVRLDQDLATIAAFEGPLQVHVGSADEHVPAETVEKLRVVAAGKPDMTVFAYDGAGHGFFNPSRPEVHDAAAAQQAFDRAVAVLRSV
jgi:carboxymethylenebutenolidase